MIVNVILATLRPWYEKQISDEQIGFHSNCRTADDFYTVKSVQQISNPNKPYL
jgi:hypothetical protein